MPQKILIAEDEKDIRNLIRGRLEKEGFHTLEAGDGQEAVSKTQQQQPDLIVLDLMMPKMSGLDVCKTLKGSDKTKHIPIVMLTAKSEEIDRIIGFELGADDYLTKPFSPRELILRIKAILKRLTPKGSPEKKVLKFGDLTVDTTNYEAAIKNKPLTLTKTEFLILKHLLESGGRVVTKESLTNKIWGFDSYGDSRTIDTHMAKLRKKIGKYANKIETIRGVGYRFYSD